MGVFNIYFYKTNNLIMKKMTSAILIAVLLAACQKEKTATTPAPAKQNWPSIAKASDLQFTNKLPVRVIIDIYDSLDYREKLHHKLPKLKLIANPYATVSLPANAFSQNGLYFYDWYTDSLDISSFHNYSDSIIVNNMKLYPRFDSFYYCLGFRYDAAAAVVQLPLEGKSKKYRRIFGRDVADSIARGWQACDAYDKTTGQSIWSTLSANQKEYDRFYLSSGYSGYHYNRGWIFYRFHDTTYSKATVYDNVVTGTVYAELADAVPSMNLTSSNVDTLFLSPLNSSYVLKMCFRKW
jgi:hypothetical protein